MKPDDGSFDALRAAVARAEQGASTVSKWTVGEHVHHCCLAMIGIVRTLERSTQPPPPSRKSIPRSIVFLLERIPRGRARSPQPVIPQPAVAPEKLLALIDESAREIGRAHAFDRGAWMRHPLFGPLHRDDALKFARIHNRHHLRIVRDILKTHR